MICQLYAKYQFGAIHTADTTYGKVTNRALLSAESEKVHRLYLPTIRQASIRCDTHCGLLQTRRVPVEGKSSVCLICMKYMILIFIIISLGQILLSYIANTSRTHACPRTRAHACASTHPHRRRHRRTYRLALFIGAQS